MGDLFELPRDALYAAGILAILNLPCYVLIGKAVFDSWENFLDAVRFWFTPEILSALRGEYEDDFWAELKLWLWAAACVGLVLLEFFLVSPYFLP